LLEESTAHHTLVDDGVAVYDHYQSSHQSPGVSIRAVTNWSGSVIFDPRAVGTSPYLSINWALENNLYSKGAELVGEEELDGIATYHIRVRFDGGGAREFWLDKAHPERLLQAKDNGTDIVKSKYDESNLSDPIPVEVNVTESRNGAVYYQSRLVCTSKNYNTTIDAESFTLAGMGLAVGTDVSDDRIHRRLGYWTGSGLSEKLPSKNKGESQPAPRLDEMLAVLESDPASSNGLQSATWIILNTPDGDAVKKAANVILRDHVTDTNLVQFCQEMDRARPSCSKELLSGLLQNNPSIEVRGNACFTLATMLKDEAKYGQNKEATAQAIEKYQQVIAEFSSVKQRGYSLADLAKPELNELQNLIIGKPAPEFSGVDMNGQPMKLSDYRGKVTVVVFWSGYFTEALKFQKINEELVGKPFALIGVNCDNKASMRDEYVKKVTWPSFKDGREGPIAKLWNVNSWTDTWVLDRNGVIRYRDVRVWDVAADVKKLMEE
jgi:peroxiredoxin